MATPSAASFDKMVFRKTNSHSGRHIAVTPQNSTMRHLNYSRIILQAAQPHVPFSNGDHETCLVCLSGSSAVNTAGAEYTLERFDAFYIPRDSKIDVSTKSTVDFAELSAEVKGNYPLQVVRYAEISKDSSMSFVVGIPGSRRQLNVLVANNVEAGRLLAGFTYSEPGNWTSWPSHERARMLGELYVYFDMPDPAYGLQLVYNDTHYPELIAPVRDGDAVLMPSGYHPNVAVPGHRIAFLWAMAAHTEVENRKYGVVNIRPGFQQGGSGLEAARK